MNILLFHSKKVSVSFENDFMFWFMWFKLFWVDMSMVEMEEFNQLLQNTRVTNGLDLVIWKMLDMAIRQFMMESGRFTFDNFIWLQIIYSAS